MALDTDARAWRSGLLDGVMRAVIEAVLEAELAEHLKAANGAMVTRRSGGNCRNGARIKSVRTVAGYVTIRSPRDRWGTFQPVTVGKWQRRVVGIDRLVLPLAAAGSSLDDTFGLVAHAYGSLVGRRTLLAMAASVRARLDPWHQRRMPTSVHALLLGRAVVRSRSVGLVARPVHTAVGVAADGSRELLGLWMRPPNDATDHWWAYLRRMRIRGLAGVDAILCDAPDAYHERTGGPGAIWPGASVQFRPGRV